MKLFGRFGLSWPPTIEGIVHKVSRITVIRTIVNNVCLLLCAIFFSYHEELKTSLPNNYNNLK